MACGKLLGKGFLVHILAVLVFIFPLTGKVTAQNITKRLWVGSGGAVAFNFNSLTEYSSGKTLNNWTRLNMYYQDATDASTGWEILVRAGTDSIQSDGAAPDLPLSTIQIKPTTIIPNTIVTNITLTNADQIIVESTVDPGVSAVTGEIVITYECGTATPLLGKQPDYYFVDLIFTLVEK